MKSKIIIGIIIAIAFMQCSSTDIPVAGHSDDTLPDKIARPPEYKDGKYEDMGTALNLSFTEFASTTWDFLFSGNHRTPDTELPVKQVDLSHFGETEDSLVPGGACLDVTNRDRPEERLTLDRNCCCAVRVAGRRLIGPSRGRREAHDDQNQRTGDDCSSEHLSSS